MKIIEHKFMNDMALHARPTTELIAESNKFKSKITIIKDNIEVNAKSLISVLSLVIDKGDTITIKIEGEDEEEAEKALTSFLRI